ncbi:MAG: phosphoribosyltransferase, partial [Acidobacteria bacterium]|nr:phosphoribosyltransferase [Acidobacteriota bacterium]
GASIRAAIKAVAATDAMSVVVAVPVAPVSWRSEMPSAVDELIVVQTPEPFSAVGWWYRDFTQTTDGEVQELLAR